nr:GDP-fucose protein O-fucosyltransferase [Tanacetum cinerariifolium]
MGQKLVNRMRKMGKHYVALHLRFEPDMLAFSGCYYGGGEKERKGLERRQGRCPLTPEEVGLMLRALGYSKDVHLYVASGEVYGGGETLAPLRALFPNIHSNETIAT